MGPEAGQSDMQPNFPPSRLQGQLVQAPVPLARGRCQKLVSRPLGATYHRDNGHGEQGVWQVDLRVSGPGLRGIPGPSVHDLDAGPPGEFRVGPVLPSHSADDDESIIWDLLARVPDTAQIIHSGIALCGHIGYCPHWLRYSAQELLRKLVSWLSEGW